MLTAPVVDGDRVVQAASKGGDDRDPDWYRNLIAHPEIELTMAGRRRPKRARWASGPRSPLAPDSAISNCRERTPGPGYQGVATHLKPTDVLATSGVKRRRIVEVVKT